MHCTASASKVAVCVLACALAALYLSRHKLLQTPRATRRSRWPAKALISPLPGVALSRVLAQWRADGGVLPPGAAAAASRCGAVDAAGAALEARRGLDDDTPDVVVDVGPSGHAVAAAAQAARARLVIAVEPRWPALRALAARGRRVRGADFVAVHASVGEHVGLLDAEEGVKPWRVTTVDTLLASHSNRLGRPLRVDLLRIATGGAGLSVLRGANDALDRDAVGAVLADFDPALTDGAAGALDLLRALVDRGMQCVHTSLSGGEHAGRRSEWFKEQPLQGGNIDRFYDFMVKQGGWTVLLCVR